MLFWDTTTVENVVGRLAIAWFYQARGIYVDIFLPPTTSTTSFRRRRTCAIQNCLGQVHCALEPSSHAQETPPWYQPGACCHILSDASSTLCALCRRPLNPALLSFLPLVYVPHCPLMIACHCLPAILIVRGRLGEHAVHAQAHPSGVLCTCAVMFFHASIRALVRACLPQRWAIGFGLCVF